MTTGQQITRANRLEEKHPGLDMAIEKDAD